MVSLSILIRIRFVICSWKIDRSDDLSKRDETYWSLFYLTFIISQGVQFILNAYL
jgi:hypothetical protein